MRYNDESRMSNDETSSNPSGSAMLRRGRQMTNASFGLHHSFGIRHPPFCMCSALTAFSIAAEAPPSAKEILNSVRMVESKQQLDLQGQLRQNDVVVPFRLVQNGQLIRYSFTNPEEVLQLRLGENGSRLDLVNGAETEKFAASKLNQRIRDTSVTYEGPVF